MSNELEGSVTLWIGDLKNGGDSAAQHLWDRYFDRLVSLAHKKIQAKHGGQAVADGEDAALDAFNSFCKRAALGQFPLLHDRDDLWRLLVVITIRKVAKQVRYERALIRGGGLKVNGLEAHRPGADPRVRRAGGRGVRAAARWLGRRDAQADRRG